MIHQTLIYVRMGHVIFKYIIEEKRISSYKKFAFFAVLQVKME